MIKKYILIDTRTTEDVLCCEVPKTETELVESYNAKNPTQKVSDFLELTNQMEKFYRLISIERPMLESGVHHPEDICPSCKGSNVIWGEPDVVSGQVQILCKCMDCKTEWIATGKLTAPVSYDPTTLEKEEICEFA